MRFLLVISTMIISVGVAAQTWQCTSDELFQSRYKNSELDPFMEPVPVDSAITVRLDGDNGDKTLTIEEDGSKPQIYAESSPYMHIAHWRSEDGEREMIVANRMTMSMMLNKKPQSEDYLGVKKLIEIVGNPEKPIIREWTQIYNCLTN